MSGGKELQSLGAEQLKALLPMVLRRAEGEARESLRAARVSNWKWNRTREFWLLLDFGHCDIIAVAIHAL
ncbi:hypothetical protein SRHO_G00335450 [Serrasalmus rhombeus]